LTGFYTDERDEIISTDGLEEMICRQGQRIKKCEVNGNRDHPEKATLPPLLELLDKLGRQAETFLKASGTLNLADNYVVNSINLCQSILEIRKLLHHSARQRKSTNSAIAASSPGSREEAYKRACLQLCYDEFPTSALDSPFTYNSEANSLVSTSIHPRRTVTLAKELCTMATSLPPGIFVRNIPNRPDCIKALIAGPEGTPYDGGLFEFDIFAPANYPASPPKMHFLTTAQNRVRFNPNLYAHVTSLYPLMVLETEKFVCR
jgi:Ubiquitin-conjugating enzyme